jgi:type VI protein secretion system component VasK
VSGFSAEIAVVHQIASRLKPGDPKGQYAVPWYMVIGAERSGRTSVIRSMNLTWVGENPVRTGVPQQLADYWISNEAVFIEPGPTVVGPRRLADQLPALCAELLKKRPREPLDGVVLILSTLDFADLDEQKLETYAQEQRQFLVDVCRELGSDTPVYIVLNRYDTLWGFAEAFAWSAERAREEPWGFRVPPATPSQQAQAAMFTGLEGLGARIEAQCLARLSSEEPPEIRIKAYQHLVEAREMLVRLKEVLKVLAITNAYEKAPWVRALTVGCAVPGMGDRIRATMERFSNMGLMQAPYDPSRSTRPGGLPIFSFVRDIVVPERDLVPLRTRWRDDGFTVVAFLVGIVFALFGGIAPFLVAP